MMSHTKRRVSVILTRIGEKAVANVVLSVGIMFGLVSFLSTLQIVCGLVKCKTNSRKFNTMSAFFARQLPVARKYSILAKVCFDAKRGGM